MRYGGLGVGSGSFFVGFRGRARVGDSIKGSIYNRGKDLFTFFVYLRFAHPVHPIGDIYCPSAKSSEQKVVAFFLYFFKFLYRNDTDVLPSTIHSRPLKVISAYWFGPWLQALLHVA